MRRPSSRCLLGLNKLRDVEYGSVDFTLAGLPGCAEIFWSHGGCQRCFVRNPQGRSLGIGGPNGAGKTTLFELISGLSPADRGEILFEGQRIEGVPAHSICHLGIARVFQSNAAFDSLTAHHNVLIAAAYGNSSRGLPPFPSTEQFIVSQRKRWILWGIRNHWARSLEICLSLTESFS